MERQSVVSSNLASVGYDAESQVLEIEFLKGGIYQYSGVWEDVFNSLMAASSKGTFFAENIKHKFPFHKV